MWKKIAIPFAITFAIGAIYLFFVFKHREAPGVSRQAQRQQLTADDVAIVRMEFPQHFEDVKDLEGKSVWMKSGYTMPFYPYAGGRVEWNKPAGLIPPNQKLDVKKVIKAKAPAAVHDNIEHGDAQAMVVFALPEGGGTPAAGSGPAPGKQLFATPVGFLQGSRDEHYYDDMLFYYDDPHTIYSHWPRDVWTAIDAHQVKPGMSELQTRTAIGMRADPDGDKEGDRTVDYDVNGKQHVIVTYRHDKATSIQTK